MHKYSNNLYRLKELFTFPEEYSEQKEYLFDIDIQKKAHTLAVLLAHADLATPELNREVVIGLFSGEITWPKEDGSYENIQADVPIEMLEELGLISFYAGYCKTHFRPIREESLLHESVKPVYTALLNLRNIIYGMDGFVNPYYSIKTSKAEAVFSSPESKSYIKSLEEINVVNESYNINVKNDKYVKLISTYLWKELTNIYSEEDAFKKWIQIGNVESSYFFYPHAEGLDDELRKVLHNQITKFIESDSQLDRTFSTLLSRWACESNLDSLLIDKDISTRISIDSHGERSTEVVEGGVIPKTLEDVHKKVYKEYVKIDESLAFTCWWRSNIPRNVYEPYGFYYGIIQDVCKYAIHIDNNGIHEYGNVEKLLTTSLRKPELRHTLLNALSVSKHNVDYILYLLSQKETSSVALYSIATNMHSFFPFRRIEKEPLEPVLRNCLEISCDEYLSVIFLNNESYTDISQLLIVIAKSSIQSKLKSSVEKVCLDILLSKLTIEQVGNISECLLTSIVDDKSKRNDQLPNWKFYLLFWLLGKIQDSGSLPGSEIDSRTQMAIVSIYKNTFLQASANKSSSFNICESFDNLAWERLHDKSALKSIADLIQRPIDWISKISYRHEDYDSSYIHLIRGYFHLLLCICSSHGYSEHVIEAWMKIQYLMELLGFTPLNHQDDPITATLFMFDDIPNSYSLWQTFSKCIDSINDQSFEKICEIIANAPTNHILKLYDSATKESRRLIIRKILKYKSEFDLGSLGIASLEEIIVFASANNELDLAKKALVSGQKIVNERFIQEDRNHHFRMWVGKWEVYTYKLDLLTIASNTVLSADQKIEKIKHIEFPISIDAQHLSDVHISNKDCERFRRSVFGSIKISDEPLKAYTIFNRLYEEVKCLEYSTNRFSSKLRHIDLERGINDLYRHALAEWLESINILNPQIEDLKVSPLQSWFQCLYSLKLHSDIETLWSRCNTAQQSDAFIARSYCQSLMDRGLNQLAKKTFDRIKDYHRIDSWGEDIEKFLADMDNQILKDAHSLIKIGSAHNANLASSDFDTTIAIIIGIEKYKLRGGHQIDDVIYAGNDALLFKNILIERFNVEEANITMYLDEDALKNDLEHGLGSLFHSLSEKDRLIFYYVGHGFHDGTTNYLSTYDTHPSNIAGTSVSLRKILFDPLSNSKCKSSLVFIDSCAQSFKHDTERALITNLNSEDFLLFKSEHPQHATFLSCQPGQKSYSCHDLAHGIWTYHLGKALKGEATNAVTADKYVTDRTLNDYLSKEVSDYVKNKLGFEQNPKAVLDSSCENVILEIKIT